MVSAITAFFLPENWDPQRERLEQLVASGEIHDVTVVQVTPGPPPQLPVGPWRYIVPPAGMLSVPYSYWNNRAIPELEGDWVLHLNDDVLPVPGSIPLMQKWLEEHPEAGMIGGDFWFGEVPNPAQATPRCDEILNVMPAGLMLSQYGLFRRPLWDQVQFDESPPLGELGWGSEDNDVGCQMRTLGLPIYMIQQVRCGDQVGPFYYCHLHIGVHASGDRLADLGIDVGATRKTRWNYANEKWGPTELPDGHFWDWEREDDYEGPGRYSLRATVELAHPPGHAFHIKIGDGTTRHYMLEPDFTWKPQ